MQTEPMTVVPEHHEVVDGQRAGLPVACGIAAPWPTHQEAEVQPAQQGSALRNAPPVWPLCMPTRAAAAVSARPDRTMGFRQGGQ